MILVRSGNLTVFDPNDIGQWTNGQTIVTPLTFNNGSIWVRNERDGTKLNFSEAVFNRSFRPVSPAIPTVERTCHGF